VPLRACLFGASDDTGNLGVAALLRGVLAGIAAREPDAEVVVFDHGAGQGDAQVDLGERVVHYRRVGAPCTRRLHRRESLTWLQVDAAAGTTIHAGSAVMRDADVVLVIAGGDSFGDLYGRRRLHDVTAPMRLSLRLGRPLVLLPQTYGPYRTPDARRDAADLVRRADMCWSRDRRGLDALAALAGPALDPGRHRLGVDVAYALPAAPAPVVEDTYGSSLADDGELVAVNVSGLLANHSHGPDGGSAGTYRSAMVGLVQHVLRHDRTARVVLVPHVVGGTAESDEHACADLAALLGPRVTAANAVADPGLVKGLIARASWFCGARMHATIAALSSGVPAAAVAYSDKFSGVFDDVGRAEHVVDARGADEASLTEGLVRSYERRHDDRAALRSAAAHARVRAEAQFDDILDVAGSGA
jgi:polysaccharide pyruvyl transferase WcaK-like protein